MDQSKNIIAAIDIGTNSFHLCIAEVKNKGFTVVHREREVFRLREKNDSDVFLIPQDKINGAITILKKFSSAIKSHNAFAVAVATSALREAANRQEVINQIFHSTGINVKIISGDEEAKLAFAAVRYFTRVDNANCLVFDLGGGSTEIILAKNGKVVSSDSIKLGAVRHTQKYFPDFTLHHEAVSNCIKDIQMSLDPLRDKIYRFNPSILFGIGGTITSIGWLIEKNILGKEHNFKIIPNYTIIKRDFEIIRDLILSKKTEEELKSIPGLDEKRADVISAGMLIINELFNLVEINEIILVGYGLREGIIIDSMEKIEKSYATGREI